MSKFIEVEVDDRVFSIYDKWGTVVDIDYEDDKPIKVKFDNGNIEYFDFKGKTHPRASVVALYWREVKLPTEEEDTKFFSLMSCLKKNLKHKEFSRNGNNHVMYFDVYTNTWRWIDLDCDYLVTVYFEGCPQQVTDELTKNNITPEQLKEAFQSLGWL